MALHEQSIGKTDEWYTPPHIFDALGCHFNIDVASPGKSTTPWIPANTFLVAAGLERPWDGFIWMNPPFGGRNGIVPWLQKFFDHGNGIALTPDRTSAPWWQEFAPLADVTLFVAGKIKFIGADGKPGKSPAQGTTLFAVGDPAVRALYQATASGLGFLVKSAHALRSFAGCACEPNGGDGLQCPDANGKLLCAHAHGELVRED